MQGHVGWTVFRCFLVPIMAPYRITLIKWTLHEIFVSVYALWFTWHDRITFVAFGIFPWRSIVQSKKKMHDSIRIRQTSTHKKEIQTKFKHSDDFPLAWYVSDLILGLSQWEFSGTLLWYIHPERWRFFPGHDYVGGISQRYLIENCPLCSVVNYLFIW